MTRVSKYSLYAAPSYYSWAVIDHMTTADNVSNLPEKCLTRKALAIIVMTHLV